MVNAGAFDATIVNAFVLTFVGTETISGAAILMMTFVFGAGIGNAVETKAGWLLDERIR